ncbi:MAG: formaldehyde-activating enzyme [Bdellovibrionales bacterium]|nr:formaldehyde-activating enzyme [Bdellovibrionales bacterium]
MRFRIADALVLDPTRPFEAKQLATFGEADNPLHNLGHNTVYFLPDDTDKGGPNAAAFADALNNHGKGHTHLIAELTPGVATSPKTVIIPTVTMGNLKQAIDMWSVGQEAVGWAIHDLVKYGVIPKGEADNWLGFVQVYIDPMNYPEEAGKPNHALWEAIYMSTYVAGKDAWEGKQDVDWMLEMAETAWHPFGLGSPEAIAQARNHAWKNASLCIVTGDKATTTVDAPRNA